ncbi:MAG: hypothetical protein ACK5JM_04070 [Rhodoblastus sp.]
MFVARGLVAAEAHLAYPLVSCRYPTLSLALWQNYVRNAESEKAPEKLICLIDQRDRRHAVFAYGVDRSQPRPLLRVSHIATFQLIGDVVQRALMRTFEIIATENGCREVAIETWAGCDAASIAAHRKGAPGRSGKVLTLDTAISTPDTLH